MKAFFGTQGLFGAKSQEFIEVYLLIRPLSAYISSNPFFFFFHKVNIIRDNLLAKKNAIWALCPENALMTHPSTGGGKDHQYSLEVEGGKAFIGDEGKINKN